MPAVGFVDVGGEVVEVGEGGGEGDEAEEVEEGGEADGGGF